MALAADNKPTVRGSAGRLCVLVLGLLLLWWAVPASAAIETPRIDALELELKTLQKRLDGLHDQMRIKTREMESLATRIDDLKEQQKKNPSLLGRLRLEKLLAESLEVSQVLDAIELKIRETEAGVQAKRETLAAEYDRELERTFAELKAEKDRRKSVKLLRKYIRLRRKRNSVKVPSAVPSEVELIEVKADPLDSPEELIEKADLIKEFLEKLSVLLSDVEMRIEQVKREIDLNREMNLLIEEGNLFEDGTIFDITPRLHTMPEDAGDDTDAPDEGTEPETPETDATVVHTPPLVGFGSELFSEEFQNTTLSQELQRLRAEKQFLLRAIKRLRGQEADLRATARKLLSKEKR